MSLRSAILRWCWELAAGAAGLLACAQTCAAAGGAGGNDPHLADLARRLAQRPQVVAPVSLSAVAPAAVAEGEAAAGDAGSGDLEQRPLGRRDAEAAAPAESAARRGSWMLETLAALGVVILAVFGARAALRRWNGGGVAKVAGPGPVDVLARVGIGARQQVVLLRVGQRVLVVGQTAGELSRLGEICEPEEVADVLGAVQRSQPGSMSGGFRQLLQRFHGEHLGREAMEMGGDESEGVTDRAREGLSGLLSRLRRLNAARPGSRP